jgi:DNA polymerase III subunit beta
VPEAGDNHRIKIETAVFKEMVGQVVIAAATDDARPTLTGVMTRFEGTR